MRARFTGELFEHGGEGSWFFVAVPLDQSDELRDRMGHRLSGFGSLRVRATIGATSWDTSVFPTKEGPYLLPVKKAVRRAEQLEAGDHVDVELDAGVA